MWSQWESLLSPEVVESNPMAIPYALKKFKQTAMFQNSFRLALPGTALSV